MPVETENFNPVTLGILAVIGAAVGGATTVGTYILYNMAEKSGSESGVKDIGLPLPVAPKDAIDFARNIGFPTPGDVVDNLFGFMSKKK